MDDLEAELARFEAELKSEAAQTAGGSEASTTTVPQVSNLTARTDVLMLCLSTLFPCLHMLQSPANGKIFLEPSQYQ